MKLFYFVIFISLSSNSFSQYHFYEDLKYLIKTYPSGEIHLSDGGDTYWVEIKDLTYIYLMGDDDIVDAIVLDDVADPRGQSFKNKEKELILKSIPMLIDDEKWYYYEDLLNSISFRWRFTKTENIEYEKDTYYDEFIFMMPY